MFTAADFDFMRRALLLGERAQEASPNPRVGCVIVRDDEVLAEGWTQAPGEAHAEIEALRQLHARGQSAQGLTVYVSLEPCAHFGRTPPCASALARAGVARVVVAVEDPNPRVAGRGLQILRDAGIDVRCGLLEQEAREANIGFFSRMTRGRPWVRLKLAGSLDGRSALPNGVSQWITSPESRADAHRWRARASAILTGIGTVLADDPQLTARDVGARRQPLKVIVDSHLRVPPTARLFDGNPVVLACVQAPMPTPYWFDACQARALACPGSDGRVDLPRLLRELANDGVNELHVETGGVLAGALLHADLIDEVLLYQAPVLLGPGHPLAQLPPLNDLGMVRPWALHEVTRLGQDLRLVLRRPIIASADTALSLS
jgi:diaminohydroxyphosphoribosylaminopyrimidine deaminase/5-amino-6-(5-phosphoribosylamino)uracil reductase